jgi:hypothetical protein
MPTRDYLDGVFEAATQIASNRCELLRMLRSALQNGNVSEALNLARTLCGLHEERN